MLLLFLFMSFLQFVHTLISIGYIVAGIIMTVILYDILLWFYHTVIIGMSAPLLGHRAYFYIYRGDFFYSEWLLRLLFFRLGRNKKWAIHSAVAGYVRKPFLSGNNQNNPAEIFTRSFGQKGPVAVAKFVNDAKVNVKKADIIMQQYFADGSSKFDETNPVGYVDVQGNVFKYFDNYNSYKNKKKLPNAVIIGTCCDIIHKQKKSFETKGEDNDISALPYIEGNDSAQYIIDPAEVEPTATQEVKIRDSWFSLRINRAILHRVRTIGVDTTKRRGIHRFIDLLLWSFINVVPIDWDVKAKAFGYGYCKKNFSWGNDDVNVIPLTFIGCAALLLLEKEGFMRYEDEVVDEPKLGWAETVMVSLLVFLWFYNLLLKASIFSIVFPFIGPELSLVVVMTLIYFGIWAICHFFYNGVLGRPLEIKRLLNMLNANVGTLSYTKPTLVLSIIGFICTIWWLPSILAPFFLAMIVTIVINRTYFPQRRWEIIDPFDTGEAGTDDSDNSELSEKDYSWTFQNSFRDLPLHFKLHFNEESIEEMRKVNPFQNNVSNYAFTVKRMILDELNSKVESNLKNAITPSLLQVLSQFSRISVENKLTKIEKLNMILSFVQQAIQYKTDTESGTLMKAGINGEYCRFSRETLFDQEGDCDCKSELAATLFAVDLHRVAYFTTKDHAFVGITSKDFGDLDLYLPNSFIEVRGEQFLYCETTGANWIIGNIPEGFNRSDIQEVEIIDVSNF